MLKVKTVGCKSNVVYQRIQRLWRKVNAWYNIEPFCDFTKKY